MSAPSGSGTKLVAWLFKDRLLERAAARVAEIVGDSGISKSERERHTAELNDEIRRLEHEEESLIVQALDAGLDVHRRYQASPFALLGLEVETQAALLQAAE
jgi:hypothetical protein